MGRFFSEVFLNLQNIETEQEVKLEQLKEENFDSNRGILLFNLAAPKF